MLLCFGSRRSSYLIQLSKCDQQLKDAGNNQATSEESEGEGKRKKRLFFLHFAAHLLSNLADAGW